MRFPAALLITALIAGCDADPGGGGDPGGGVPDGDVPPTVDLAAPATGGGDGDLATALVDLTAPADLATSPSSHPIASLDRLALVIIVGDSVAAGFNARGRNDTGGRGYARLMVTNHPDFPAYTGHDLATRFPGVAFRSVAESGATSREALDNLRGALGGNLPRTVDGDVLVLINVGGNDFNDDVRTIIDTNATRAVAARVRMNLAEMFRLLRARYEDPAAGKRVVFLVDNVHDTTDGTGAVPAQFRSGFCRTLQNPLFTPQLRMLGLMNLALLDAEISAEVTAQRGELVDIRAGFIGHGMNSGAARLIDDDCVHPTSGGHDLIRRLAWKALTGEEYP